MREYGIVKTYLSHRNFGFIIPDDRGPDVFFHRDALEPSVDEIRQGVRVSFEKMQDKVGRFKAVSIELVKG